MGTIWQDLRFGIRILVLSRGSQSSVPETKFKRNSTMLLTAARTHTQKESGHLRFWASLLPLLWRNTCQALCEHAASWKRSYESPSYG
jgi:hypothetical protein